METTTAKNNKDLDGLKNYLEPLTIGDLLYKNGVVLKRVSHQKFKAVLAATKDNKPASQEEYGQINRESALLNIVIVIKENNGRT